MAADLLVAVLVAWPFWAAALLLLPAFITSPSCGCCNSECDCSDTSSIPEELSITIVGVTNGAYPASSCCSNFNGTFIVTKISTWAWEYRRASPCDCASESDEDVLSVWVDEDCYLHVRWTVNGFAWKTCTGTCTQYWDLAGNYLRTENNCVGGCGCIDPQPCPMPGFITSWDYACVQLCEGKDQCYFGWRRELQISGCLIDFDEIIDYFIYEGTCPSNTSVSCAFGGGTYVSVTAI